MRPIRGRPSKANANQSEVSSAHKVKFATDRDNIKRISARKVENILQRKSMRKELAEMRRTYDE